MKTHQKYELTFLLLPYFLLISIGVVETWSSSRYFSYIHFQDSNFFLKREIVFVAISLFCTFIVSAMNYKFFKKITPHLIVLSLFFLSMLYLGLGISIRGATRWINLGINFEPSQFAELSLIVYIAYFISEKEQYKDMMRGIVPVATVVGVFFLLIALEPDVGTAILIFATFLTVIYISGYSIKNIGLLLLPSIIILMLIIYTYPEKLQRIINFFLTKKTNIQVQQSLTAIGSGGLFGHGIGAGNYKNLFIPDSYNDFIISGIGEDMGFFGIFVTITLFVSVILSIFSISSNSSSNFGKTLSLGIGVLLSFQALMNLFSVLNLMPPKGITMPFISYGGTSLIVQGIMIGMVISVYRGSCGKKS